MTRVRDDKFEGGAEETWETPLVGAGSSISFTANPADVGSPSNWGTGCMRHISAGTDCHTKNTTPSPMDVAFVRTELVVASSSLEDEGDTGFFGYVGNPADDEELFSFRFLLTGGALNLLTLVNTNGSLSQQASTVISVGTRYRLEYMWNNITNLWAVRLDGSSLGSGGLTGSAASFQLGHVHIGGFDGDYGRAITIYEDLYAIDDTDWVGEETSPPAPSSVKFFRRKR